MPLMLMLLKLWLSLIVGWRDSFWHSLPIWGRGWKALSVLMHGQGQECLYFQGFRRTTSVIFASFILSVLVHCEILSMNSWKPYFPGKLSPVYELVYDLWHYHHWNQTLTLTCTHTHVQSTIQNPGIVMFYMDHTFCSCHTWGMIKCAKAL